VLSLLSIDLLSKQLIEINWVDLTWGIFCAKLYDVELILQTFLETLNNVKVITFQYLEQKQVGSTSLILDGNSAA